MKTDYVEEEHELRTYTKGRSRAVSLTGPVALWLVFVLIGLLLLVTAPLLGTGRYGSMLALAGTSIIGPPGDMILPLIVAIWVGERIAAMRKGTGASANLAFANAAYMALVYAVAIFVVYLMLAYARPAFAASISITQFLIYYLALPAALVILVTPIFTLLSVLRGGYGG